MNKRKKQFRKNERGSVMMEYVIINLLFIIALAISGYFFLDPDGGTAGEPTYRIDPATGRITESTETTERFGILGNAMLKRYDLMRRVVSMPYP